MGEGLIDGELNYEESRNRALALIQNLKEACLLEACGYHSGRGDTVKMHDVVRDVAIWISSHDLVDGCRFLVRAGMGLSQLSQVKFPRDVKRISFMNNHIDRLSSDDACLIECSSASTLLLQGNRSLVEISDEFLQRFQAVKVLNLIYTNINSLPPSIMQLTNLRTLLLRCCENLEELPTSGWEGLGRMQVLDLSYTAISELPMGMARLIKLRELDLKETRSLKSIPAGVFSMLPSLEILEMRGSSYLWRLKGEVEDGEAHLEKLETLNMLRELFINVNPKSSLSWDPTWTRRLRKFLLWIGHNEFHFIPTEGIIMNGINLTEEERIGYLLTTTNAASLDLCKCGGKWVQNMGLNPSACFSALKSLTIKDATINLRGTLGRGYGANYDLLPNLEDLYLSSVKGLRRISELAGHLGLTFSKLHMLTVSSCDEMKYTFSVGDLILENLEWIDIHYCNKLEGVFEYPHGGSVGVVPNLKVIDLSSLPELRTLCNSNKAETWPSLEMIIVEECAKLRKLPIDGQNNSIKKIKGEEEWWSNLE